MPATDLPLLENRAARAHFLHRHVLDARPSGRLTSAGLAQLIHRLGFVQLDSVSTVERAHHMILHARAFYYRPPMLTHLAERRRGLFEQWTHDAALIPMEFHPYWALRTRRDSGKLTESWTKWQGTGWHGETARVLQQVRDKGRVMARELTGQGRDGKAGWWDWQPSKTALEFLWRTGDLAISGREGFQKVYDLPERIIPDAHRHEITDPDAWLDWHMIGALDRLGFASAPELSAFWGGIRPQETRAWVAAALARGKIEEINVEGAEPGRLRRVLARPGLTEAAIPEVTGLTRILSPFDPALRDRNRAEFLFGFHYRIEIFVPEAKRRWGYYVFPVLEGDRLIGRIDARADSASQSLNVAAWWPERGIRMTGARKRGLDAALLRTAKLAGCTELRFASGWMRDPA